MDIICNICSKSRLGTLQKVSEVINDEVILPISMLQVFIPDIEWPAEFHICRLCKANLHRACDFREMCLTGEFIRNVLANRKNVVATSQIDCNNRIVEKENADNKPPIACSINTSSNPSPAAMNSYHCVMKKVRLQEICHFCSKMTPYLCAINQISHNDTVASITKLAVCVPEIIWLDIYRICSVCKYVLDTVYDLRQMCFKNHFMRQKIFIKTEDDGGGGSDTIQQTTQQTPTTTTTIKTECYSIRDNFYASIDNLKKYIDNKPMCNICLQTIVDLQKLSDPTSDVEDIDDGNSIKDDGITSMTMLIKSVRQVVWMDFFNICKGCIKTLFKVYDFHQMCHNNDLLRQEIEPKDDHCNVCLKSTTCNNLQRINEFSENDLHLLPLAKLNNCLSNISWQHSYRICDTCQMSLNCAFEFQKKCINAQLKRLAEIKHTSKYGGNSINKPNRTATAKCVCEYCDKCFKRRGQLNVHIRIWHTLEKPFQCEVCGLKFAIAARLTIHQRRHNNDKPARCRFCNKGFYIKSSRDRHEKIHSDHKDYGCKKCERRFNSASILRTHIIYRHTDRKEWKFSCPLCEQVYPRQSGLTMHLKRHNNDKQFVCEVEVECGRRFITQGELNKHIRWHARKPDYKCEYCEMEFRLRSELRAHLKDLHNQTKNSSSANGVKKKKIVKRKRTRKVE